MTTTAERKALRSAAHRLKSNQDAMAAAYNADIAEGQAGRQRHQWRVVAGWLMSEARAAGDDNRQAMLDHLLKCAQDMNKWSRPES